MDHVKAAEKYVAGHKPDGVHPDVAAAMHRFTTAKDTDAGDVAVAAHAESLNDMVRSLGDAASVAPEPDPRYAFLEEQRAPAKPAAKKSTAKRSSSRRSRS